MLERDSRPKRPAWLRPWAIAFWLGAAACGAAKAADEGKGTVLDSSIVQAAPRGPATAQSNYRGPSPSPDPNCTAPVSGRTWVGFSEPFDYDHFGEAALHAELITSLVHQAACVRRPDLARSDALVDALSARAMVVATLTFTRTQLDTADVLLEPQDKSTPAPSFVLGLALAPAGAWQLISISVR